MCSDNLFSYAALSPWTTGPPVSGKVGETKRENIFWKMDCNKCNVMSKTSVQHRIHKPAHK